MTDTSDAAQLLMKIPSFKFDEIGASISGEIVEISEKVDTEYGTDEPKILKNGSVATYAVVTLLLDNGTKMNMHANKPGIVSAVSDAVQGAGDQQPRIGARLTVTFSEEEPSKKKGFNPKKIFSALYELPSSETNEVI